MEHLQIKEGIPRQVFFARKNTANVSERPGQLGNLHYENCEQTLVARTNPNNQAKPQCPDMHRSTTTTARSEPKTTTKANMQGAVGSIIERTRTNSGTLLDFLRGQSVSELNATAPAFVPAGVLESENRIEQRHRVPSFESRGIAQVQRQCYRSDGLFLSPSDSSSPVWSEPSPPLIETPILNYLPMLPTGTPDLNLPAMAPMFGGDSAFAQLKQIALYQKNLEMLNCLRQALQKDIASTPTLGSPNLTNRPRTTTALPTFSRPCMPINLPDLVASQSPTFSPIIPSIAASPNLFPPVSVSIAQIGNHNTGISPSVSAASSFPSPDSPNAQQSSVRESTHIYSGRRYPRSIPLARMLERRLASVPEETSNVTSDSPNSPVMAHSTQEQTQSGGNTSASNSTDFDEGLARSLTSPDGKTRRQLRAPSRGDRASKAKKSQAKTKAQDIYLFQTEQENVEPTERPTAQKKRKNKQGTAANKSKSKSFRTQRKEH